mgnify:CR=1 FL=1
MASPATPPTTPPAIAPEFDDEDESPVSALPVLVADWLVVVGAVVDIVDDGVGVEVGLTVASSNDITRLANSCATVQKSVSKNTYLNMR